MPAVDRDDPVTVRRGAVAAASHPYRSTLGPRRGWPVADTWKAMIGMVTMFAVAILVAAYLTGGIGDGVGLFEDDSEAAEGADGRADVEPDPAATQTRATDLFTDDDGTDAEESIELAVRNGAMTGCGPEGARTFCPQEPITRAEFAVALDAVLDLPEAEATFEDVPADAPFAGAVARIAAAGVTSGCSEAAFCPADPVTRAQAAALVARTIELPAEPVQSFDDVPADSTFADVIGRMAAQGIVDVCSDGPPEFCPDDALTRGAAASLLDRAGLLG